MCSNKLYLLDGSEDLSTFFHIDILWVRWLSKKWFYHNLRQKKLKKVGGVLPLKFIDINGCKCNWKKSHKSSLNKWESFTKISKQGYLVEINCLVFVCYEIKNKIKKLSENSVSHIIYSLRNFFDWSVGIKCLTTKIFIIHIATLNLGKGLSLPAEICWNPNNNNKYNNECEYEIICFHLQVHETFYN